MSLFHVNLNFGKDVGQEKDVIICPANKDNSETEKCYERMNANFLVEPVIERIEVVLIQRWKLWRHKL